MKGFNLNYITKEIKENNLTEKVSRVGAQRSLLNKAKEELFEFAIEFNKENGRCPKVGNLRKVSSEILVAQKIEEVDHILRTNKTKKGDIIKIKDWVVSRALILELFQGKEDLYR